MFQAVPFLSSSALLCSEYAKRVELERVGFAIIEVRGECQHEGRANIQAIMA